MSSATCVEAIKTGENNMKTSWRSIEPKGIEDYLKDLCVIYRGEVDNPHDVNAILDEEPKKPFRFGFLDCSCTLFCTITGI